MENGQGIVPSHGIWSSLVRAWFALTRRKIRLLRASEIATESPAAFAVSHPPGFLHAVVLSVAVDYPVHCLLPRNLAHGALAHFLARHLGIILYEGDLMVSEEALQGAIDVLASGESLVVFADQNAGGPIAPATAAASLIGRVESQLGGRRIAVYPVHLFLPESTPQSREILIYIDSAIVRPAGQPAAAPDAETACLATALEARFEENAFQLRPADLEFFLSDLEEVLRTGLQEDWASRPDWKQDTGGFVLSSLVVEWVKQTNYLHPSQLVVLRKSLDDYRALQKQCALRELEVEGGDSPPGTGWRRVLLWFETLLGFPVALYGLLNHWAIALVLFMAGSFKRNSSRPAVTNWIIRGSVTLAFYILQIFLVAHIWGRAAAGYYAPSLPVSGAYLWRYAGLVRPQARLLFISITIPALKRKIQRHRHALLKDLDRALASVEEKTSVAR
jgi:hypothetical protein